MATYVSSKIENGATYYGKWYEKNEIWCSVDYDVTTYSDNSQLVTINTATIHYRGWRIDGTVKPQYCLACCGLWGMYWASGIGGGAAWTWNFSIDIPIGVRDFQKTVNQSYLVAPGGSLSVDIFRFGTDTGCGWSTRAFKYSNPLSKPSPSPPSLSPSCRANTANGNTIVFNGGGGWGYCESQRNTSSYAIYDSADMTTAIQSGSGYSATVSGLSPNTRYWASFTKSNGCYTRSAACSAVTVTPNELSDPTPKTWEKATVRLAVTNGGGEYAPTTDIYLKKCSSGSWSKVATSTTTAVETIEIDGLDPETCYQVQARTTTDAGTYTGNTVQFNTPKKGLCVANYTEITPSLDEKTFDVCANLCYEWQTTKVPAQIRLYYRVKDGYDTRWYYVDAPEVNDLTGTNCVEICDLYPNQTVYETYIHTETDEATYDSDMWEFITPVVPEPDIHNCENFDYLTALVCQAIVALYDGLKEVYANDCSKELCDPESENPTYLTLFSRILRHFHAMYCLLCDMGNARFMASKPGQYLVGEAGWQDIITKIQENSPNDWKIATSDAIKRYLMEKLHTVWHFHGSVDYLVENLSDLDKFPDATSAIVASENKLYRKEAGRWVASTVEDDQIDDMGVWHINNESNTEVGYVQAGSAWYSWQGDWQPLDADVVRYAKIIDKIWEKKESVAFNEDGTARLHINTMDKLDWSCDYPAGERWVTMITEPLVTPALGYHLVRFQTGSQATLIQNQDVLDGATAQQPANPQRTGYTFSHWESAANPGVAYNWSDPVTTDVTLVAIWTPIQYTITFNLNGGTGTTPSSVTAFYGDSIPLPTDAGFTREGAEFVGWTRDGVPFTAATTIVGDTELLAAWKMDEFDVTIHPENGQSDYTVHMVYNSTIGTLVEPVKADSVFIGWFTSPTAGTGAEFDLNAYLYEPTDVYARYVPDKYIVEFDSAGGTAVPSQTVAYQAAVVEPTPEPTKAGVEFGWWMLDGKMYPFGEGVTEDITLVAKWLNYYTVDFVNTEDETISPSQTVLEGYPLNTLTITVPSRPGYMFEGWYNKATNQRFDVGNQTVQENMTLVAIYKQETS